MLTQRDGTGASRQQKWKAGRRPKDTAEQPGNRQPMVDARNLWLAEHRRNIAMLRHFGRGVVVPGSFQLVPAIRVEFDMDQQIFDSFLSAKKGFATNTVQIPSPAARNGA